MSALACCTGAPEALQHPDHADREREHGAGRERESREEEERPQDWISKLSSSLLVEFDCCSVSPRHSVFSVFLFFFSPSRLRNGSRKEPPTAEGARRSSSCEAVNNDGCQFQSGSQLRYH